MTNWFPLLWLGLAVLLALVELATPQMVSIWFAAGAAVTVLVSLAPVPFAVQLASFVLVSCVALALSRPLARRVMEQRRTHTNADAVVGMEGVVTEAVDNLQGAGRVQVNGLSWSARSEDGEAIPSGGTVRVLRIDGVKVIVRPEPQSGSKPQSGLAPEGSGPAGK